MKKQGYGMHKIEIEMVTVSNEHNQKGCTVHSLLQVAVILLELKMR